jgi:hypothetical protein
LPLRLVEQVLGQVGQDVRHVEEGVPLQAHVHERRLHPGQHPGDAAFIDVPGDAPVRFALDEQLGDHPILQESHLGLLGGGADDQVLGHGRSLP